ncbi:MAG: TolC family protein [Planctomycetota bacterium]
MSTTLLRTCSFSLLALLLGLVACASQARFPAGFDPDCPLHPIGDPADDAAPPVPAVRPAPAPRELVGLGLGDCLELAIARNRDLQRAALDCRRERHLRVAARRAVFDPRLAADYRWGEDIGDDDEENLDDEANGRATLRAGGRLLGFGVEPAIIIDHDRDAAGGEYTTGLELAVSRRVFRFNEHLRDRLPLTRANRDFHIAVNRRLLELRALRLAVVRSYYDIQRYRRRVAIRQARVADSRAFLAAVGAKVDNGFAAPVQRTNAEISLNQAEADLLAEEANLQGAREDLLRLFGLPLSLPLSLVAEEIAAMPPPALDLDRDIALVRARHERVLNSLLSMEVLRREMLIARDDLRPDLGATVALRQEYGGDAPFDDSQRDTSGIELRLDLALPLDGWAAERAGLAERRLRLRQQLLELAETRDELEGELRAQHRAVVRLETTEDLLARRVEAERARLAATLERYEAGTIGNLEVTRAKEDLDRSELALLEARIARIVAEARYHSFLPAPPEPDDAAR